MEVPSGGGQGLEGALARCVEGRILYPNTPNLRSSHMWGTELRQASYSYKTIGKIIVLYILASLCIVLLLCLLYEILFPETVELTECTYGEVTT
jgi:uncharacterized membrane protein